MPRKIQKSNATQKLITQRHKLESCHIIINSLQNIKDKLSSDKHLANKKLWQILKFVEKEIQVVVDNIDIVVENPNSINDRS